MDNFLNTTLRNIAWIKQAADNNQLEMRPAFQRNAVWLQKEKSYLIDTVLNGYPIPEIYMQESISEDGQSRYIVVDGQQRLTAVLDYLNDKYPIDPTQSPEFNGAYFSDLNIDQRRTFFQYNFVVRILPQVGDSILRDIFQRLNKNVVSLNDQELRQATYNGAFIKTINEISDFEEFDVVGVFTANDRRRMLDAEFVSELAVAYKNGLQNKKLSLETYYQFYEQNENEIGNLKQSFQQILREIVLSVPEIKKTRWCKKTDFYTLFLVMANHVDSFPLASDKRVQLHDIILSFGNEITECLKADAEQEKFDQGVRDYSSAVRASSDLSCRRTRNDKLEERIRIVFQ